LRHDRRPAVDYYCSAREFRWRLGRSFESDARPGVNSYSNKFGRTHKILMLHRRIDTYNAKN
jgi:hypothetical protein